MGEAIDPIEREAVALWFWDDVGCFIKMREAGWKLDSNTSPLDQWIEFWKSTHGSAHTRQSR